MGDSYFTKLYDLRNDDAKQKRNSIVAGNNGKVLKPQQSNGGCESVSNDTRSENQPENLCEAITNDGAKRGQ